MERLTVTEIRTLVANSNAEQAAVVIAEYGGDARAGVRAAIAGLRTRLEAADRERRRLTDLSALQRSLHEQGWGVIAGIDEVGRGALAGPVTAAAVVLDVDVTIEGIDDSKRLTPDRRRLLDTTIRERATCVHVAHVWPDEIDSFGIQQATRMAMLGALKPIRNAIDHVIVDLVLTSQSTSVSPSIATMSTSPAGQRQFRSTMVMPIRSRYALAASSPRIPSSCLSIETTPSRKA